MSRDPAQVRTQSVVHVERGGQGEIHGALQLLQGTYPLGWDPLRTAAQTRDQGRPVFETQTAFDTFVNAGWELGAQATAAAQASGQGGWAAGAASISRGVWLYQLTDNGLALELTAKGTKYYKDEELN